MLDANSLQSDQTPGNPASDQAPNCLPLRLRQMFSKDQETVIIIVLLSCVCVSYAFRMRING